MEDRIFVNNEEYLVRQINTNTKLAYGSVKGNEIIIKLPVSISKDERIRVFLNLKKRIIRKIEKGKFKDRKKSIEFYNGQEITIMGRAFKINVSENIQSTKNASGRIDNNEINILIPGEFDDDQKRKAINTLARHLISKALIGEVIERTNELNSAYFNFKFNGVRIKDQKSRWGSCSAKSRRINLSFRLLFFPRDIIDSVIVHELAHLKEHNHSKRFYQLVERAIPDYRKRRKWLRETSDKLNL